MGVVATKNKDKKQVIIETAARLFRDKGYVATSMKDLAEAVALKKASSLYSHIGSKEEILRTICFDNANQFKEGMDEIQNLEISPKQKIEKLIQLHIDIALNDNTSVTAFNDEWRHLSEPFLQDFLNLRKNYEQQFCTIIEAGKAQGDLKNIETTTILYTILSAIRWLYDWRKPNQKIAIEKITNDITTMLLSGIMK